MNKGVETDLLQPITSISVHPRRPDMFCTTARDFTTRIYDISLSPVQEPNNPHWPPNTEPSLAGPAHGLHMCEHEGEGTGRCVAVMVGGRSGGHKGAVLCSVSLLSFTLLVINYIPSRRFTRLCLLSLLAG